MKTEIAKGIYWVGAVDWNVRNFHGHHYHTPVGTTYNAYLIVGKDENVLVDTVHLDFYDQLKKNIEEIVPFSSIKHLVLNHAELDHSGSVGRMLSELPNLTMVCTARCRNVFDKYFGVRNNYHIVKTGNEIKVDGKTLVFVEAQMLHWPDSMFTYIREDNVLLPNDAFGQHIASSGRFADMYDPSFIYSEARKYYANILTPYSDFIPKKVEELGKLGIAPKVIAPSHGLIWRTEEGINGIIKKYLSWAAGESGKKVTVMYDTMWGSTEKMVQAMLEVFDEKNLPYRVYKVPVSDKTEIMGEVLESRGILIAAPTMNKTVLSTMTEALDELVGLSFKKKVGIALSSMGWGGGAVAAIEKKMAEAKIEIFQKGLEFMHLPNEEEFRHIRELAAKFADKILGD